MKIWMWMRNTVHRRYPICDFFLNYVFQNTSEFSIKNLKHFRSSVYFSENKLSLFVWHRRGCKQMNQFITLYSHNTYVNSVDPDNPAHSCRLSIIYTFWLIRLFLWLFLKREVQTSVTRLRDQKMHGQTHFLRIS